VGALAWWVVDDSRTLDTPATDEPAGPGADPARRAAPTG